MEALALHEPWWPLLVWSLAELGYEEDFASEHLKLFLDKRYSGADQQRNISERELDPMAAEADVPAGELPIGALLHTAWACVALGISVPRPLLQEACQRLGGSRPASKEHLHLAQVTALACSAGLSPGGHGERVATWLRGLLAAPAKDVAAAAPDSRLEEGQWDTWLSRVLVELQVPHECCFTVGHVHRVSIAVPPKKQAMLVLGPADLAVPSLSPLGSAALRRRQLEVLGWQVEEVTFRALQSAEREGQLEELVAPLVNKHRPAPPG